MTIVTTVLSVLAFASVILASLGWKKAATMTKMAHTVAAGIQRHVQRTEAPAGRPKHESVLASVSAVLLDPTIQTVTKDALRAFTKARGLHESR